MDQEQRIVNLEMKWAHQELLLEELHQVIYEQQKVIDHLSEKFNLLAKRVQEAASADIEIGAANEKPPHY